MQGRLMVEEDFQGTTLQFDVKLLPSGAFQVILNGHRLMTTTLVVIK